MQKIHPMEQQNGDLSTAFKQTINDQFKQDRYQKAVEDELVRVEQECSFQPNLDHTKSFNNDNFPTFLENINKINEIKERERVEGNEGKNSNFDTSIERITPNDYMFYKNKLWAERR